MYKSIFKIFIFIFIFLLQTQYVFANVTLSTVKEVQKTTSMYRDNVQPGEHKKYKFFATNNDKIPQEITIYPSDVLTSENGGYHFLKPEENPEIIGKWFTEGKQKITLQPNEIKEFDYNVNIPNNLKFGQYLGAIVVNQENVDNTKIEIEKNKATVNAKIVNVSFIEIVLDYKPEQSTHDLKIIEFNHGYEPSGIPNFIVKLRNDGTILEKPNVSLSITDSNQKTIYNNQVKNDSFYTGTNGYSKFYYNNVLPPGSYIAHVIVNYSSLDIKKDLVFKVETKETQKSLSDLGYNKKIDAPSFNLMQWIKLYPVITIIICIVILILLILVILNIYFLIKRRNNKN